MSKKNRNRRKGKTKWNKNVGDPNKSMSSGGKKQK